MEINEKMIDKVRGMSEEQLKDAIAQIADALGATGSQKRRALNNANLIKRKIMNSSKNELQRQVNKILPEQQEEIAKMLKL